MSEIYLCDDEPVWLERLKKYISDYQIQSDWLTEVAYASQSPSDLLNHINKRKPSAGIYFLDVDYKQAINGMELGAGVRQLDPEATFVFITTHEELVMETFRYKLMALDYILKDQADVKEQVWKVLGHIEERLHAPAASSSQLRLKTPDGYSFLSKEDIYYVSSLTGTHKLSIHTSSQILTISRSLSELEQELGRGFARCQKGCVVNLKHVQEMRWSSLNLLLDNGEVCHCSTRLWHQIKCRLNG